MARKPTPSHRDPGPLPSSAPDFVEAAAAAAANAADVIVAPPWEEIPAPLSAVTQAPESEPELQAATTEPAFAPTPRVAPLAVAAEVVAAEVALSAPPVPRVGWGAMATIVPPLPAALAQAGEAYLHAWLDCQREAARFLDRQLECGRRAQRQLSACDDVADATRIQRDWSAAALKACFDEAACVPVLAAKFWSIGLAQLAARAKPAAGAPPA